MSDHTAKLETDLFAQKVVPLMDKVRERLNSRCADEMQSRQNSLAYLASGAVGPDGGMTSMAAQVDTLRYTGKWNSKTVEDYIAMVREELVKQHIEVTPDIEQRMIDKMINEQVPNSTNEYLIKKAGSNSLFHLPQAVASSPLQKRIEKEAEQRYNPSALEKGAGWALGAAADYLTTGGMGGTWAGAAKFVGVDMALNAASDALEDKGKEVPSVIDPDKRGQYLAERAQSSAEERGDSGMGEKHPCRIAEADEDVDRDGDMREGIGPAGTAAAGETSRQDTGDYSGWNHLMESAGLSGFGDTFQHLGLTLATLPDMLLGLFTGKTKSVGLNKETMIPLAAIISGSFIRNPLLRLPLMLYGGAALFNRLGQESMKEYRPDSVTTLSKRYRQYADEALNARIRNPHIEGNTLVVDIDNIPRIVTLPPTLAEAYQAGAVPLNTLANRILDKSDQMAFTQRQPQEMNERFEQEREREQIRGIR